MTFHKITASIFGIGYVKGGGSIAAAVTCLVWYFILNELNINWLIVTAAVVAITISGIWSGNQLEKIWGKDSSRIVIDEVAGMAIGLLFVPVEWKYLVASFILFRFFDISKILYVRRLEVLPGGWGVMGDDVLAGVYTNIILQIILYFKFF
jgi:phosphatidylglycerophosphatase A